MSLDAYAVLDAFSGIKVRVDDSIVANNLVTYSSNFLPRSEEIAVAIFCNALEELGCPIRSAPPGTVLERIRPVPEHKKLVEHIYGILEKRAGLITTDEDTITRTSKSCPSKDIHSKLNSLQLDLPAQDAEIRLMEAVGQRYGDCLAGKADVVQLLFQSAENRSFLNKLYATSDATKSLLQLLNTFIEEVAGS